MPAPPLDRPDLQTPVFLAIDHLQAKHTAVSAYLANLEHKLAPAFGNPETTGTILLVLGEALNNIVEHAYRGISGGQITLRLQILGSGLRAEIRDQGHQITGPLPEGRTPLRCDAQIADLPEGGFGWSLIRALTQSLSLQRAGADNVLTFVVPAKPLAPPPCPAESRD